MASILSFVVGETVICSLSELYFWERTVQVLCTKKGDKISFLFFWCHLELCEQYPVGLY